MKKIAFLFCLVFVFVSCSQKGETYADWEKSHPESTAVKDAKGDITFEGTTTIQREGIENPNINQKAEEYENLKQGIQQELNPSDGIEEAVKETNKRRVFEERYTELDYDETFGVRIGRDDLNSSLEPQTISGRDAE